MVEKSKLSTEEAHRHFATSANNRVWELLNKPERTHAEDEEMQLSAYASLYHWRQVGTAVHHQRGEWLISRVHAAVGNAQAAQRHARNCARITEAHKDAMSDFDVAYAHEAMARAHAVSGYHREAQKHLALAQQAGEAINDDESRRIFLGDLESGNWYGVK